MLPDKRTETDAQAIEYMVIRFQYSMGFSIVPDYEKDAYLGAKYVFPGIGEEGCFFHMAKRLDLHVKQLGLMLIDMGF